MFKYVCGLENDRIKCFKSRGLREVSGHSTKTGTEYYKVIQIEPDSNFCIIS